MKSDFDFSIQYEFGSLIQNQDKTIPETTFSFCCSLLTMRCVYIYTYFFFHFGKRTFLANGGVRILGNALPRN